MVDTGQAGGFVNQDRGTNSQGKEKKKMEKRGSDATTSIDIHLKSTTYHLSCKFLLANWLQAFVASSLQSHFARQKNREQAVLQQAPSWSTQQQRELVKSALPAFQVKPERANTGPRQASKAPSSFLPISFPVSGLGELHPELSTKRLPRCPPLIRLVPLHSASLVRPSSIRRLGEPSREKKDW